MDTISIKGKKYEILKITKSQVVAETPGILAGAKILTNGFGGNLKIFDARSRNGIEPLLVVECKEGRQENEQILIEPKKYEGGICVELEGINAEARLYHKPFDIVQDIHRILEILENEHRAQWVHTYEFLLDTAKTNHLIDQFPSKPRYLYVKELTGTVILNFDSQNEPSWTLATKDIFRMVFDSIYLTWTAQATKKLIFYVSNREILMSTLS